MSVRLRISLITGLLLLCVLVLVSIFTLRAQRAQLYQESVKRVELALSMISEMAAPPLGQGDTLALADVAERAAKGQPARVCIADMHGIVLADSKHELYDRSNSALRTVVRSRKEYVARTGDLWQGAAPVMDYQGNLSGMVYVAFSARPMDEANAQVTRGVVMFALCLTGVGALVAYVMGFYFSAVLSPLLAAIRKTASGDYGGTIRHTGMSELDEIGRAFDRMTGLVGSELHNLVALNQLAADLTAAKTLEEFAGMLQSACRTLVDGCASLLSGDPRMGVVELVGAQSPKRRVTQESAAFRAVNERRPVTIGQDSELPPDSLVAEDMRFGSGIVAPLIMSHTDEALSAQMGETRFVTLFFCIFDPKHQTIAYCCAGHLPGLLYRAESDDVTELSVGGGVVGMGCGATSLYEQDTVRLKLGDTLLLYTDGISEAAQRGHDEYGLERLKGVVRANARRSLKNIAGAVMDDVREFAQNVARDDMTLVLLRLSDESAESPL